MAGRKNRNLAGLKDTDGGARRNDRQSLARENFEPISIDAENAMTVIYLLQSPENAVILRAIASLERFARKGTENLETLSSLGILKYVLPLVRCEDYLVRRFAQKLIAQLCALEGFRQNVLAEDGAVLIFADILQKENDVVMHEFASLTLAELSSECFAASKILQIDGCVYTLYARLSSPDPDVQKNCLDTMRNLLDEIDGVQYFMRLPDFDLKPVLELTSSDYPVIQIAALNVIQQFMSWSMDDRIACAFRDSSGPNIMIGILENSELGDLHMLALDIMSKVVDNPLLCEYLRQSGCLQRVVFLLGSFTEAAHLEKILGILARVSQTDEGRKALHANGMGQIFGEYLRNDCSAVLEPVCLGVASMAKYPRALDSIMATRPTAHLLGIVTDCSKEWKLREMASYALNILSHEDYRASEDLLDEGKLEKLLPLLGGGKDVPVELLLNILQIFIGISANEKYRETIISEGVVKPIMDLIQDVDEPYLKPARLQIVAMECLSGFLVEGVGRSIFQALGGARKLIGCLKNRYASLRQWAALLVTQMSHNLDFVKDFIRLHGLQWMIDRKEMRYSAPSWESAIEAVFRAYLPAKFAIKGRLDMHDLTQEGFFILRHNKKLFFILDDLLEVRASPAYPVYVANFDTNKACAEDKESESSGHSASPEDDNGEERRKEPSLSESERSYVRKTDETGDGGRPDAFATCPRDPYLPEYLRELRRKLTRDVDVCFRDPQWLSIHPRLIRQRARILARFVADEMSGPDPDPVCKDHYLETHINDVRYELETNVIPIGHIRVGSYLERAFLFKVLADRVGLPCAFVRGSYGRAWVEIAIPSININERTETKETQTSFPWSPPPSLRSRFSSEDAYPEEEDEVRIVQSRTSWCSRGASKREPFEFPAVNVGFSNAFPTRLLKANAIVDLVQEPGRLLPMGSREADEYIGGFLYSSGKTQKCH